MTSPARPEPCVTLCYAMAEAQAKAGQAAQYLLGLAADIAAAEGITHPHYPTPQVFTLDNEVERLRALLYLPDEIKSVGGLLLRACHQAAVGQHLRGESFTVVVVVQHVTAAPTLIREGSHAVPDAVLFGTGGAE